MRTQQQISPELLIVLVLVLLLATGVFPTR